MDVTWKRPWTIVAWLIEKEQLTPEEPPDDAEEIPSAHRGFLGWLTASEAESFQVEPEVEMNPTQYGKGGFIKWLFGREQFEEEPEIPLNRPRFENRTFFRWLILSEGDDFQGGCTSDEPPE